MMLAECDDADNIASREPTGEWADYDDPADDENDDVDADECELEPVSEDRADMLAAADVLSARLERYVLELIVREANDSHVLRLLTKALAPVGGVDHGDDLIGAVVEPTDAARDDLLRALHAAVCLPWPTRTEAAELLPRWRRLRLLEVLGALVEDERRELHEHSFRLASADRHGRSYYWRDLPRVGTDRVVCVYGRPEHVRLAGELRLVRVARLPDWMIKIERDLRRRQRVAEYAQRKAAARVTRHERGTQTLSNGAPSGDAGTPAGETATPTLGGPTPGALSATPVAPLSVGLSSPLMSCDSSGEVDTERSMPPTVDADLPVSLLARRDELGDRGLYVCHLLWRTRRVADEDSAAAREGWRPLAEDLLRFALGESTVDGKRVVWRQHLMGSRNSPGLLERLGIIERRSGYMAGAGHAQRYRLRMPYSDRSQRTERVTLIMRARVSAEHAPARRGPPVHPWLEQSYGELRLDYFAALADLCVAAGVERTASVGTLTAAIAALPKPKRGKDPRPGWQAEARALQDWSVPESAGSHHLERAQSNGRLQSPFASLPSRHRKHVTLGGERMVCLDIAAAQIASLCAMLRAEGVDQHEDAAAFVQACDAVDAYGYLFELVHGRELGAHERDSWKTRVCSDLLYGGAAVIAESTIGRALSERHPSVHAWLVAQQASGASAFCRRVQWTEARVVLDLLPPRLAAAGIPVATVHDGLYVPRSAADRAAAIFGAVLAEAGVRARLRREEVV